MDVGVPTSSPSQGHSLLRVGSVVSATEKVTPGNIGTVRVLQIVPLLNGDRSE